MQVAFNRGNWRSMSKSERHAADMMMMMLIFIVSTLVFLFIMYLFSVGCNWQVGNCSDYSYGTDDACTMDMLIIFFFVLSLPHPDFPRSSPRSLDRYVNSFTE